ncbi:hypothetical protein HZB02_06190 [Candidatus Woesearchaeota archaeon]|nr:hypothetical protein [Candidatus Woesearchaeota archaeon]
MVMGIEDDGTVLGSSCQMYRPQRLSNGQLRYREITTFGPGVWKKKPVLAAHLLEGIVDHCASSGIHRETFAAFPPDGYHLTPEQEAHCTDVADVLLQQEGVSVPIDVMISGEGTFDPLKKYGGFSILAKSSEGNEHRPFFMWNAYGYRNRCDALTLYTPDVTYNLNPTVFMLHHYPVVSKLHQLLTHDRKEHHFAYMAGPYQSLQQPDAVELVYQLFGKQQVITVTTAEPFLITTLKDGIFHTSWRKDASSVVKTIDSFLDNLRTNRWDVLQRHFQKHFVVDALLKDRGEVTASIYATYNQFDLSGEEWRQLNQEMALAFQDSLPLLQ